jgi:hypothetical protein
MHRFSIVFLLAAMSPALADDSGRFAFVPTENGVFRLDTATGEVALCMDQGGALVCLTSPRPADGAATRQPDRVAEIEARIAALEAGSGAAVAAPHDDAIGRVRILAERMVGRVVTLVRRMKGAPESEEL